MPSRPATGRARPQQCDGRVEGGAELAGEIDRGLGCGQGQAHEQARPRRGRAFAGHLKDFLQFGRGIQHEIADPVDQPGFTDGRAAFDRVHEMNVRVGKQAAHQRDLGDRGAVEMADPAGPDGAEDRRLRVAFHCIEHVAGEAGDEGGGSGGDHLRAQAVQRHFGAEPLHHFGDAGPRARGVGPERGEVVRRAHGFVFLNQAHGKNPRKPSAGRCQATTCLEKQEQPRVSVGRVAVSWMCADFASITSGQLT